MNSENTDFKKNEDKFFNLLYPSINTLLEKFGFEHKVIWPCPTKLTTYDGKTRRGDFVGLLDNGDIINIEAHSTAISKEDKKKFFDYASYFHIRYRRKVHTLVFSSYYKDNNSVILDWHGTSPFTIPYKSFNTFNAEKTINKISLKNKNKEELNKYEIDDLRILTFMNSKKSHKDLLIESVQLTNEAVMKPSEREYTKTLQCYLAEKFIKDDEELEEVIRMIEANSEELSGVLSRRDRIVKKRLKEEMKREMEKRGMDTEEILAILQVI